MLSSAEEKQTSSVGSHHNQSYSVKCADSGLASELEEKPWEGV